MAYASRHMSELPSGTVTLLFTDIEGSTRLLQELGDAYVPLLEDHHRLLRQTFSETDGHEVDTQGDAFFVAYRRAKDAVAGAVAAQRALASHRWPEGADVRVRMGIHTGEPTVGADRYIGLGVHKGARICSAAHGGQILLSAATWGVVQDDLPGGVGLRDLGERRLKDVDRPERLYQLDVPGFSNDFPPLRLPEEVPEEPDWKPDLVVLGQTALESGDWNAARRAFEEALAHEESPEALDGLGQALWWMNDLARAIEFRERAYGHFAERGDLRASIAVAVWLAREYFTVHGNLAASGGWVARAERLCAEAGACPERGWLELLKGFMAHDPLVMRAQADAATAIARDLGDRDLETVALSLGGLAAVYAGEIKAGMSSLDEAMAAATGGEIRNFTAISDVYCNTLLACERAGDFERAEQWTRVVAEFARRRKCEPMFPFCHVTFGGVLTATGRWDEAERELELAMTAFDLGHRAMRVLAVARLADLRLRQGRFEEAAELLGGYQEHPLALRPVVRLHLARGELAEAGSLVRRRLGQLEDDTLLAAPVRSLLGEIQLAETDFAGARATAEALAAVGEKSGQPWIAGQAELLLGRAENAEGRDALAHLERAYLLFSEHELPLEAAHAQLELARAQVGSDPRAAAVEARRAKAAFERLGAASDRHVADELLGELATAL
jgi:class 3 adenylate cyclase